MGDLTRNISRIEIACRCGCGLDTIDFQVIEAVQDMCDYFENMRGERVVLRITSGARCATHNAFVGGADKSQHVQSRAMDVSLKDISIEMVYQYLDNKHPTTFGIGKYDTFVHIDSRADKARWKG